MVSVRVRSMDHHGRITWYQDVVEDVSVYFWSVIIQVMPFPWISVSGLN